MRGKSLRDIAKLAGVSVFTVSLALRNRPQIAEVTRKRILKIAKKVGYAPQARLAEVMAQTRAAGLPKYQSTLGYLDAASSGLRCYYTMKAYREGAINRAATLGYKVDVFEIDDLVNPAVETERILRSRGIRGLLMMWPHHHGIPGSWHGLWEKRSCVFLAARPAYPSFALAMSDHFQAGALAYEKAFAAGHRRIGVICDDWLHSVTEGRFLGGIYAQQQLQNPKMNFIKLSIGPDRQKAVLNWYQQHRPECIISMRSDVRGFLESGGVRVPDQVSIIYWDVDPTLYDIYAGPEQHPIPIAEAAVELLVNQLHHNQSSQMTTQRCLLVEPVWRDGSSLKVSDSSLTDCPP